MKNINATVDAVHISAAGDGQALGSDLEHAQAASDAQVDNRGAFDAFVKFGGPDVTASATAARVPAGAILTYGKGQGTHVAVYSPGGTPDLYILLGQGS